MTLAPGLGGLPPRRPDQQHDPAPPAVPTGANAVFKGRLVVISGTAADGSSGLFVYSPTPAAGNLVASITSVAGSDSFGNAFFAGITSYDPHGTTDVVNIVNGMVQFTQTGSTNQPAFLQWANASLTIQGAAAPTGFGIAAQVILAAGVTEGTVRINSSDGSPARLVTTEPNNFGVTTAWHSLSGFAAGWSVGIAVQYRFSPMTELLLDVHDLVHDGVTANPDGTTILSSGNGLPASFVSQASMRFPAYCNTLRAPAATSGAALEVEPDGSIQCYGMAVAATRVDAHPSLPLDAA